MIEPLSPQAKAWVRQSAAVGVVTSQALEHLLERVEALEAAQQQPHQDKLDRLIALDRGNDEPTPAPAPAVVPVAVSERLPDPRPESEGGDCDAEGRCWFLMPRSAAPFPHWSLLWKGHMEPYHSHWLPASAIPAPSNYIRDKKAARRPRPGSGGGESMG